MALTINAYLQAGGGGGGFGNGSAGGGGGGAGGAKLFTGMVVAAITPIPVTIGVGGLSGIPAVRIPTNGGPTIFNGNTVLGGGFGGYTDANAAGTGGCGGGANGLVGGTAGLGTATQGYDGGTHGSAYGSGGGGTGTIGGAATPFKGGDGGDERVTTLTPSSTQVQTGIGGGGGINGIPPNEAGVAPLPGQGTDNATFRGQDGFLGLGCGGGGGFGTFPGGSGSDGQAYIYYLTGSMSGTGGEVFAIENYTFHFFRVSGFFIPLSAGITPPVITTVAQWQLHRLDFKPRAEERG